jgi:Fuc2NAc and GlcNAc transferase
MGDVGSSYLGFIFACLMLLSANDIGVWSWLIILAIFVVDTIATLLVRILAKQRLFDAHQSHNYQQLARYLQSHQKVCGGVVLLSVIWLAPLALLASTYDVKAMLICVFAYTPMLFIALRYSAKYYKISFAFWR